MSVPISVNFGLRSTKWKTGGIFIDCVHNVRFTLVLSA